MAENEHDEFIESIASELRRPVRFDASFDARVMAALEPQVIPLRQPARKSRPWLLRPRTFSLTPLTGLAAAAALAGIAALATLRPSTSGEPASQQAIPVREVAFETNAAPVAQAFDFVLMEFPNAKSVSVVGDFNGWDEKSHPLTLKNGVWTTTLMIMPGRHEYQFIVDGEKRVTDPAADSVASDFGGSNSVLNLREGLLK
jgi:hypothetical protein